MAEINTETIKQLREESGLSVMQCKKALEEAEGDMEQAKMILSKKSKQAAEKKADRELGAGVVRAYIHNNNAVGVLLELNSETDFVAQNEEFLQLADDIAMHIAAMNPVYVRNEDIPQEQRQQVVDMMKEEVDQMDKTEDVKEQIIEGKVNDYLSERILLEQSFVKDPEQTIEKLIEEKIQKIGENIKVGRFTRYAVLEE